MESGLIAKERHGRLAVKEYVGCVRGKMMVRCVCDCGGEKVLRLNSLRTGNTRSCGCLKPEAASSRNFKHGFAARNNRVAEFQVWCQMRSRCKPNGGRETRNYGDRGIRVCERWENSFIAFMEDMGPRPSPAHSIERENVNGHYEPENCRWATSKEQANNTRRNRRLTHSGETLTLTEWAGRIGFSVSTLHARLARMSVEAALTVSLTKSKQMEQS